MKKAVIKYLLAAVLAVVGSQAAFSQYTTLNAIPLCWTTPLGVDSSIYVTQGDASQKTKPDRYFYYNAANTKVAVSGGTLRFGNCDNPTTDSVTVRLDIMLQDNDTLINQLTTVINLLGGPADCQVQNEYREETLTATQTYSTNTLHSIAIEAVSGTVTVSTDSTPAVTLQVGDVHRASAGACRYLQTSVTVTITSGSANIMRIF